jgi:antitoxin component of MazEF toxin-antitoxin module
MERQVKLQKQTTAGSISMVVPKPMCDLLKFTVGDMVKVKLDTENQCVIVKKK